MLAKPSSRIHRQIVNGIEYVGLEVRYYNRVDVPIDEIKRAYNPGFFNQNRVNITSRREPLQFHPRSVILKRLN
jgi:hypothetical protein